MRFGTLSLFSLLLFLLPLYKQPAAFGKNTPPGSRFTLPGGFPGDTSFSSADTAKAVNDFLKRKIGSLRSDSRSYDPVNDKAAVKAGLKEAVRLAGLSGNLRLLNETKLEYAGKLSQMNEASEGVGVLRSLLPATSFSPEERLHMLCLLIINSVRLNDHAGLDKFYKEAGTLGIARYPSYAVEYTLAGAMYFEAAGNIKEAIKNYLALAGVKDPDPADASLILEGILRLAVLYSTEHDYKNAELYFKEVSEGLARLGRYDPVRINYLRQYNAHLERYRKTSLLINSMNRELRLKDSVYRAELLNTTKELLYQYRIGEGEKNLRIATQQRELDALKYSRERQGAWLIILGLVSLIALATLFIRIQVQKRRQEKLLHKAEMERVEQVHKTERLKLLAESQESERRRIADQLHDEVGSMLSVARLNLSSPDEGPGAGMVSAPQLRTAAKILEEVAFTIREMSHQLMPVAIKKYGLKYALQQLVSDINTAGRVAVEHIIVGMDEPGKFPEDFEVNVYRIIQELLQNIVKHSGARNVILQVIEHEDSVNLLVEDNGRGIGSSRVPGTDNGKGMEILQSRVAYYEGSMRIETDNGAGTMVLIDLPTHNILSSKSRI